MPRYQVNIGVIMKSGAMGPNFSLQIDADSFREAGNRIGDAVEAVLTDSNLAEMPPKAPASSPAPTPAP